MWLAPSSLRLLITPAFLVFVCWWLIGGPTLRAQDTLVPAMTVRHYGLDNGLPSRTVFGSVRDSFDLLWVSTERGIRRLDGHRVSAFPDIRQRMAGPLTLGPDNLIYCPLTTHRDSVEVLDPLRLRGGGVQLGTMQEGHFGGHFQRSGQPFYYARGRGIFRLSTDLARTQVHTLRGEAKLGDRLVWADEAGYVLYRTTSRELEVLQGGEVVRYQLPSRNDYPTLHRDRAGGLWAGNAEGLYHKAFNDAEFRRQPEFGPGRPVNFINEDESGNLLLGFLNDRIKRMDTLDIVTGGRRLSARHMIDQETRVLSFCGRNFRKSFRVNSYGGLYQFVIRDKTSGPFRRYLYDASLEAGQFGHVMRGFTSDEEGNVYVNKDSGMPYWFRVRADDLGLDTLTLLDNDGSVSDTYGCGTNMIRYEGDIYGHNCDYAPFDANTGTYSGFVYRYRPADKSWRRWPLPDSNYVIRWLDRGRTAGEFFVTTENKNNENVGDLYYFYPASGKFRKILTAGPAYHIRNNTKAAVRDTNRNCWWIGTYRSLYRFDVASDSLTAYPVAGDRDGGVSDILLRPDGSLLLCTYQHGLQLFDPTTGGTIKVGGVPTLPTDYSDNFLSLPSNEIATIRVTEQNRLLIATFNGLTIHGGDDHGFTYTTAEGLGSNEFNTPSFYRNPTDGRWYAGGINGFVSFRAEDLDPPPSPYAPAITALRQLNDGEAEETVTPVGGRLSGLLELPANNTYFGFDFSIPDFTGSSERQYQTFLEGHDPHWKPATAEPSVRYTDLRPGRYVFHLRAFDRSRRLSDTELRLDVLVHTPWYQTWWFYLLVFCLSLLVLYVIYLDRLARFRKDVEAERKLQTLELRALRQQLNPHFISNAMEAIRQFVLKQDPKSAARYLADFSFVMRSFLEASRKPFIKLSEEIDMLERYIGLEQLRLSDKFTSRIELHPDVDPVMDLVPSLLLQPLVENAINHGFLSYTSGGELTVTFAPDPEDEDLMIITLADNGVGRTIAGQRERTKAHISRATEILEDRLELLNRDGDTRVDLTIADLYPDREHTGTVVRIVFERA